MRDRGVGVIVYNPIAGGLLTGKYRAGQEPEDGTRFRLGRAGELYQSRYWHQQQIEIAAELDRAAKERGTEIATVAVAWTLAQPGITSAIIGASRPEQLDATVAGATFELDEELTELCDQAWWRLLRRPVLEGYR